MKLLDILSVEKWIEFEKEINRISGLNASIFAANGTRITDFLKWANRLCPEVKSNEKGQSFICAAAHQNIAAMAKKTKKPVIEECDAGLVKISVPIFLNTEFLGVAGGCGLLFRDGKVDSFLINKVTGIDVEEIENLSNDIGIITSDKLKSVTEYIEEQIDLIIHDFENQCYVSIRKG